MMAASSDLRAPARLLGRLLVREIDAPLLAELNQPDLKASLHDLGVEVPKANHENVEELAAEWFTYFVSPKQQVPLVQSLFEQGQYDGAAELGTRQFAEAAGLSLDEESARGARCDQLGAQLLLWVEIHERDEVGASVFAQRHLAWCGVALMERSESSGFYAGVCRATSDLVGMILSSAEPSS